MKKISCIVLTLILALANTLIVCGESNMGIADYRVNPDYEVICLRAGNIKVDEDGIITFKSFGEIIASEISLKDKNTYVIDSETYVDELQEGVLDGFIDGNNYIITLFVKKGCNYYKDGTNNTTVHVEAVDSAVKGAVIYNSENPTKKPIDNAKFRTVNSLVSAGIIDGDSEGNLWLDEKITRAEMASIVCKMCGRRNVPAPYNTVFSDVPTNHWAAGYIYESSQMDVINGNGDGTFLPDKNITYDEAVKMVVCVLGYGPMGSENGGYPLGFRSTADQIGLTENIGKYSGDDFCTREDIITMVYTALDIPLMERTVYGAGEGYTVMNGLNGLPLRTLKNTYLGIE